jgi:hypothetical protein
LRVPVNGQEVSLLTAAMVLGEESTIIESLLNQEADVKAADQEGNGILHALVGNRHLSDEKKSILVGKFFDQVNCADDIRANALVVVSNDSSSYGSRRKRRLTPWTKALECGDFQTARAIVKGMSARQASTDGLYYAINRHNDILVRVSGTNILQTLLDKKSLPANYGIIEPILKEHLSEPGLISHIQDYCAEYINVNYCFNRIDDKHPWEYMWREYCDIEAAIRIIQKMPHGQPCMSHAAMASAANGALEAMMVVEEGEDAETLATITPEWRRIKAAFIAIGVRAHSLND